MSLNELSGLPDDARLWCFAAHRRLEPDEATLLVDRLASFLGDWKAHAQALRVGFELRDSRFLLVAVDERQAAASGCSIDALIGQLRELGREIGTELIDASHVWYRDDSGEVLTASRSDFRKLGEEGVVGPDTAVFDLTLTTVGQLRDGGLEGPARDSWHSRLLTASGVRSAT